MILRVAPMSRRRALGALGALIVLAACGRDPAVPAPVAIAFGHDECEYCRMTIDDPHLAAEFVESSGRVHRFGEPGCLVAWLRGRAAPGGTAFVTDAERGGWLSASGAVYLRGRVRTPMAYQVAAYRVAPAHAGSAARLDWATLLAQGVTGAPLR